MLIVKLNDVLKALQNIIICIYFAQIIILKIKKQQTKECVTIDMR